MNGPSSAEGLAFLMLEVGRRWKRTNETVRSTPLFIFAAGCGSAPHQCNWENHGQVRVALNLDAHLLGALAHQFVRATNANSSQAPPESTRVNGLSSDLSVISDAHSAFLIRNCVAGGNDAKSFCGAIFSDLTADFSLYLKLVFQKAKFIFLHRHPLDAFRSALAECLSPDIIERRDAHWAATFCEQWCSLIASFELWHSEVGGILAGYNELALANEAIYEYLGGALSVVPQARAKKPSSQEHSLPPLRPEEIALIRERVGDMARRYGYDFVSEIPADSNASAPYAQPPRCPTVHAERSKISCAVLVPAIRYIEPECDDALNELERRGYAVIRMRGCPSIDQGRNRLATFALEDGFEETLWVDADTGFSPDVVEALRSHRLPIVTALCAKKCPGGGLAVAPMPGTPELLMGEGGGLVEVLYAGTGFTLVRREVYITVQRRFSLPLCDEGRPQRAIPYFMPMLEDWGGRMSYLGEDYAFSRRARLCGYKIMADTSIRLWHIGMYRYGYEDAGNEIERLPTYRHVFKAEDRPRD